MKPPSQWSLVLLVIATTTSIGLTLFTFFYLRPQSIAQSSSAPSSPAASPTSVSALGRLEPEGEVMKIAAPSSLGSARVSQLLVRDGSKLVIGQTIAIMDNYDRLQADVMRAEAQVQEAKARLAQVLAGAKSADLAAQEAEIGRLEVTLGNAEREYERFEILYRNGAISALELDSRRLTVESARKQLLQAREVLESLAEVRPTDVQQAEAQVFSAEANLQRAQAELDTAIVRSPINGQVIKVHTKPGEIVGSNGIVEVGRTDRMYVVAEIYETDIKRVKAGQQAHITSPAFEGKVAGVVEQVGMQIRRNDVLNTDPAADTDSRIVEVRIRLNNSALVASLTNLQVDVKIQL